MKNNYRFFTLSGLVLGVMGVAIWLFRMDWETGSANSNTERLSQEKGLVKKSSIGVGIVGESESKSRNHNSELRGGDPSKTGASLPHEVRSLLGIFTISLKQRESKRIIQLPTLQGVPDDGNIVRIAIAAPNANEIGDVSHIMGDMLEKVAMEHRNVARARAQAIYDDFVGFKKPFRIITAAKAEQWGAMLLIVGDAREQNAVTVSDTQTMWMDPKKPDSENRYSHLFGFEAAPK